MPSVGLVHVQNSSKTHTQLFFALCPDKKQVTIMDFTSRSGYVTIVPHVIACEDVKLCIRQMSLQVMHR